MAKRVQAAVWGVGLRLALLAMILNAATMLLPDQYRLAHASHSASAERAMESAGIPLEALKRAGLTPEQAAGLVFPCHPQDGDSGSLAGLGIHTLDGSGPLPMTAAGHACEICVIVAANLLPPQSVTAGAQLDYVSVSRNLPAILAPNAFAGHIPGSRDPPRRFA